jgi:hypothetical protein
MSNEMIIEKGSGSPDLSFEVNDSSGKLVINDIKNDIKR